MKKINKVLSLMLVVALMMGSVVNVNVFAEGTDPDGEAAAASGETGEVQAAPAADPTVNYQLKITNVGKTSETTVNGTVYTEPVMVEAKDVEGVMTAVAVVTFTLKDTTRLKEGTTDWVEAEGVYSKTVEFTKDTKLALPVENIPRYKLELTTNNGGTIEKLLSKYYEDTEVVMKLVPDYGYKMTEEEALAAAKILTGDDSLTEVPMVDGLYQITFTMVEDKAVTIDFTEMTDEELYAYNDDLYDTELENQGYLNIKQYETKLPHNSSNAVDLNGNRYDIFGFERYDGSIIQAPLMKDGESFVKVDEGVTNFNEGNLGKAGFGETVIPNVTGENSLYFHVNNGNDTDDIFYQANSIWGYFVPMKSGTYVLGSYTDDGAYGEIVIPGEKRDETVVFMDLWKYMGPTKHSTDEKLKLEAGVRYPIYMDFFENQTDDAAFVFIMKYADEGESLSGWTAVPADYLFPSDDYRAWEAAELTITDEPDFSYRMGTIKGTGEPGTTITLVISDQAVASEEVEIVEGHTETRLVPRVEVPTDPTVPVDPSAPVVDPTNFDIVITGIEVNEKGNWSYNYVGSKVDPAKEVDAYKDGTIYLAAQYEENSGNIATDEAEKLAPKEPVISYEKEDLDGDGILDYTVTVTPTDRAGNEGLDVWVNGVLIREYKKGTYSFNLKDIDGLEAIDADSDFDVLVEAVAKDAYYGTTTGHISDKVAKTIEIDHVAPEAPVITAPEEGEVGTYETMDISGTSEPESTVKLVISDGVKSLEVETTTDANGNFAVQGVDTSELAIGDITITATATDKAGNTDPDAKDEVAVVKTKAFVDVIEFDRPDFNIVEMQMMTVDLQDSYEEAPVVLASMISMTDELGANNAAGLRMEEVTVDSFDTMVETEKGNKSKTSAESLINYIALGEGSIIGDVVDVEASDVVNNKPVYLAKDVIIGEAGKAAIDYKDAIGLTELKVDLLHNYDNPIVIVQMSTYNGPDAGHIRVTDVSSDSFTVFIEEWEHFNNLTHHAEEVMSYVVLEGGDAPAAYVVEDHNGNKALLEVHQFTSNSTTKGEWEVVDFIEYYEGEPIVLSQVQSYLGTHQVEMRQKNLSESDVMVAMHEDAKRDNVHTTETIATVVIGYVDVTAPVPVITEMAGPDAGTKTVVIEPKEVENKDRLTYTLSGDFDETWEGYVPVVDDVTGKISFVVNKNVTVKAVEVDAAGNVGNASKDVAVEREVSVVVAEGEGVAELDDPNVTSYEVGTKAAIEVAPGTGHYVEKLVIGDTTVAGSSLTDNGDGSFGYDHMVNYDNNVVNVYFADYEITTGSGVTDPGTYGYADYERGTITFTANPGDRDDSTTTTWYVDGVALDDITDLDAIGNPVVSADGMSITFGYVSEDITVTAGFESKVVVTALVNEAAFGSVDKAALYLERSGDESTGTLTASVAADSDGYYEFVEWELTSGDLSDEQKEAIGWTSETITVPAVEATYMAVFKQVKFDVTLDADLFIPTSAEDPTLVKYTDGEIGNVTFTFTYEGEEIAKETLFGMANNEAVVEGVPSGTEVEVFADSIDSDYAFSQYKNKGPVNPRSVTINESKQKVSPDVYYALRDQFTATYEENANVEGAGFGRVYYGGDEAEFAFTPGSYTVINSITAYYGDDIESKTNGVDMTELFVSEDGSSTVVYREAVESNVYFVVDSTTTVPTVSTPSRTTTYTLTLSSTDGGRVVNYEGTRAYTSGSTVVLSVEAEDGYEFTGFSGPVEDGRVSMTGNIEVVANFGLIETDEDDVLDTEDEEVAQAGNGEDNASGDAVVVEDAKDEDILDEGTALAGNEGELPETGGVPLAGFSFIGAAVAGLGGLIKKRTK